MSAQLLVAPDGLRGFDCDCALTAETAADAFAKGYRFAYRYVARRVEGPNDLTASEVEVILGAGLAVGVVQHVPSEESWTPTAAVGAMYGTNAATLAAAAAGLPAGAFVFCDLEGVAEGCSHADVIAYCRAWCDAVAAGGFKLGLYVGWHCDLSPDELYALPFTAYWGAYNLDRDQEPASRGLQMKQHPSTGFPKIEGLPEYDVNIVHTDAKGDRPLMYAPDAWPA
ncbi:MAG TPA: glycoside hydrolase domain-containing protein [Gemmatimonadaceae bacterium]